MPLTDPCPVATGLLTIGHGSTRWEDFCGLVADAGIEVLVDVRSNPVSRHPQYSARALALGDWEYVHVPGLGGRPAPEAFYDVHGYLWYDRMLGWPVLEDAWAHVCARARERTCALLCSEGDPATCHRHRLLGALALRDGVDMVHVLPDGRRVSVHDLGDPRPPQGRLFGDGWRSRHPIRTPSS